MEIPRSSYFTDSRGRGFSGTVSNRTEQVNRQISGMEPEDFTRSFTTHTGPRGRLTSTQVQTPTFSSERFIYPGGSGYETMNGVERPIQLKGGGPDFMSSLPFVDKIKEGYQQVEPYLPDVDIGDKSIGYDYERPMGPGIFSLGGEYDIDDNEYGLDFGYKFSFNNGGSVPERQRQKNLTVGLDVRKPSNFRKQQEARAFNNPHHPLHANRTTYTDNKGRVFERNMRGKDSYRVNVGPQPSRDTTGVGGLINMLDTENIGYADMLNRMFGLPFNQEYLDYQDQFGSDYDSLTGDHLTEYHTSSERQPGFFNDGGIATLAGDLEQRMTPPDPQQMDPKKLTDEQKDYLYDYMLDFMFKQKQREQMENEGRIPPFNYFDMEV
jgi:hypothetical protein